MFWFLFACICIYTQELLCGSVVKNMPAKQEFNPWVGKIPWRKEWKPHQYSCLQNPMDRGAWQAAFHRVTESWARLSNQTRINIYMNYNIYILASFLKGSYSNNKDSTINNNSKC